MNLIGISNNHENFLFEDYTKCEFRVYKLADRSKA